MRSEEYKAYKMVIEKRNRDGMKGRKEVGRAERFRFCVATSSDSYVAIETRKPERRFLN